MDSHPVAKHDVDQSSNEKGLDSSQLENGNVKDIYAGRLPPDPDAHLSVEERAAIVSFNPVDGGFL